jgi:hypothetical protein
MHICYLDESGVPQRQAGTTPYFVLVGFAIPALTWRQKDAEIEQILNTHNLFGEIHTAWIARKYPEQQRIVGFETLSPDDRRQAVQQERQLDLVKAAGRGVKAVKQLAKSYEKTNKYIHLSYQERLDILRALADKIGSWDDVVIFADAQRKSAHSIVNTGDRLLEFTFEQVVTRYHHYLSRSDIELGMIVQDRNDTAAHRLTTLARRYHRSGTPWGQIGRLVETPLFVDSQLTSMVQLADLCAYAVRRFFENQEEDLLDRIYPRLDRYQGKLVGLRHYTGKQACDCRVCIDHGRAI